MEFIVDWNAVCLVCLQEGKMRSLKERDSFGIILSEKIRKCTNISLCGRNFPEQICILCEVDLEAAYRFKTNAESSNAILKSLIESQVETKNIVQKTIPEIKKKIKNEIKVEKIQENLLEANCTQTSSKLINLKILQKGLQTDSIEQVLVNNCDHIMLPGSGKLLKYASNTPARSNDDEKCSYQWPKRKNRKDYVVKKSIGDFAKSVMKAKNNNKPAKICEVCGNSYKYQNALESHMRRHRNEKPFSCEFCHRSFVANVELRRHMRVHTGQKPYACHYCPRTFSDFGSRGKHERTHTGERPYACETCGKTFAYAHVLQVHVLTHTGEKKYKCNICGKGFTKKSYLISHSNNNHSSNNELIKDT